MITGVHFIAGEKVSGKDGFQARNPEDGSDLNPFFPEVNLEQVNTAVEKAQEIHDQRLLFPKEIRIKLLESIASHLESALPEIQTRGVQETGLPAGRFEAEMGRTCQQLRQFAATIGTGAFSEAVLQSSDPDRQPIPRPDLRRRMIPLGPVAVFGASNFPLAFGVAGGDTASALAAGCPVIVKGHPAHPGVSELVAAAISAAVSETGLPGGVFSMLHGESHQAGAWLTEQPGSSAVGFTGSKAGGMALWKLATQRDCPIPVFAEMGSTNPVFIFPEALSERSEAIAEGLAGSVLLGVGQFCTSPGLLVIEKSSQSELFKEQLAAHLLKNPAGTMLHFGIHQAYQEGLLQQSQKSDVELIGQGPSGDSPCSAQSGLLVTSASRFLEDGSLQEENFGPSTLLVECEDADQMKSVANALEGQLTATIHATERELSGNMGLVHRLEDKVGRIVLNGFPTGVEVGEAMQHGGPWPASTDSRWTSVGMTALERFQRPVCWQGFSESLLPEDLSIDSSNPHRLDSEWHMGGNA